MAGINRASLCVVGWLTFCEVMPAAAPMLPVVLVFCGGFRPLRGRRCCSAPWSARHVLHERTYNISGGQAWASPKLSPLPPLLRASAVCKLQTRGLAAQGWPLDDALRHVKERRPQAHPYIGE